MNGLGTALLGAAGVTMLLYGASKLIGGFGELGWLALGAVFVVFALNLLK